MVCELFGSVAEQNLILLLLFYETNYCSCSIKDRRLEAGAWKLFFRKKWYIKQGKKKKL